MSAIVARAGGDRGLGGLGLVLSHLGGLSALAGSNVAGLEMPTEEALGVFSSRDFLESFTEDHGLPQQIYMTSVGCCNQTMECSIRPSADRYLTERFSSVTSDKKTGLVVVPVDWRDPEDAAI